LWGLRGPEIRIILARLVERLLGDLAVVHRELWLTVWWIAAVTLIVTIAATVATVVAKTLQRRHHWTAPLVG
jgi:hypothetical protein